MSNRYTGFVLALALVVSAATLPAAADAADMETRTAIVSTHGINLGTQAGQAALRHRVMAAVNTVCGIVDTRDLKASEDWHRCRAAAAREAFDRLQTMMATGRGKPAADPVLALAGDR